ncbi:NAD(P)H-binding protein [Nonomuraea candida]|uniref:NAD(P)H-binding protein n=1 Tax=Nonomuraea candida TaxID=359159 RepID=UPI0006946CB8|nr:NAD(P)H-binding protein [Nonomuraea candida]
MCYLVIGATGDVGGALVPQLLEQGRKVRALVGDASGAERLPAGVDVAVGDLDETECLVAAAYGVKGVFYRQITPLPAQAGKMVDAARSAGVSRIVLLSSIGAVLEPKPAIGARTAARDDVFRRSGLEVTYLHANILMSDALWWLPAIRDQGRVYDASDPGLAVPVDPYDVARVAALALTHDGHAGHSYILNGPHPLSARDQVGILAGVLGRDIEFVPVTPGQLARRSVAYGTPEDLARTMRGLDELRRTGRAAVVAQDIANLTGTGPRTFREWCEDNRHAFGQTRADRRPRRATGTSPADCPQA